MSYVSVLSFDGDKYYNSIFGNSTYVLPQKTVLYSSLYLHSNEKSNVQTNHINKELTIYTKVDIIYRILTMSLS